MSKFVSISVAATALGVSTSTLRRWETTGRLTPARTEGGQRRYEPVFAICHAKQVEVVIINHGVDTSSEEELASDVQQMITDFSARLYGSHSHKNQKLIDRVCSAARKAQC
jgi:predicted site-specific integrase-resolvase